ncbi:MAG: sn-glycerol-3-phosphate ABC transporter ATP-binding protein UgpC [Acidimicrobiales bacterium]|nr:sn-glycerol-3-phosphate ABC transporter ATP-binding protein UgpC [Acidimicrobiales bacterium]MYH74807.1 sn-glycerol-3-phosphate ABC transporter ATP-binding protein UgpC [Acidimicrobiales bacterium]MYK70373.1 sn-glycerol-3-phosphate ABC transporter ATP-binding protein UgpC [Acidimicrobiales bacterium]
MASITIDQVDKVYPNGFQAIYGLSLEVADGEFVVLVGPSGCGKSTALRMVAGLEQISNGELRIGERVVNDVEPKNRDIAMVFQNYALYPHMTVAENIGFALKLAKVPKAEVAARVAEAAQMLELTDQLASRPSQLSGGQRQRVAMGRAIVREPAAFLMDEPLSNLDAKLRVQMRADISRLQRQLGVTTIYVTHDQVEAMTMGDRVAVLKDGYLQQVDTPQHLYDRPDNVFVAAFIGSPSMNLYEATLKSRELHLGGQSLTLPEATFGQRPALASYDGRKIAVGVRPEDLEDATLAVDLVDGATIASTVELTESLGSEIVVHFALDAARVDPGNPDAADDVSGADAVARFDPRSACRAGEHVEIAVTVENLHFFDLDSHEAIWD